MRRDRRVRILAAVDSFSAMTANRPYRRARSTAEALEELRRVSGTQLDPAVASALDALVRQERGLPRAAASATMARVGIAA